MADWRLIQGVGDDGGLTPARGARNMAVDHALLESVQAGAPPVFRLYGWRPACISFGRNQHVRDVYDPARLSQSGIDAVRRPTGGLAVLHDRELTYCVLIPADRLGGPRHSYRTINRALVDGLRRLGVAAALAGAGAARDPRRHTAEPCFQAPACGEVVVAGRKLVGSAQRCERHTLLQHGSILLDGSQQDVTGLLRAGPAALPAHAGPGSAWSMAPRSAAGAGDAAAVVAPPVAAGSVTLAALLGAVPAAAQLTAAFVAGFEHVCGIRLAPDSLTREESARADRLEATYGAAGWTWRR